MVVCQICGHTGWPETLILCTLCRSRAGHTYCLNQSERTTDDDGEIRWVCELCDPRIVDPSDSTNQSSESQPFQSFEQPGSPLDDHTKESLYTSRTNEVRRERKNSHYKENNIAEDESSPTSEDDPLDSVEPLPDCIWRGRFCIYGKYSCTILAHMSNEAGSEASDVARSLPKLLGLDIVPKINIWPSKFRNMVPTPDFISMYFFPEDYRAERVYDRLVEYIIEHEFAMITKVNGIKLLDYRENITYGVHLEERRESCLSMEVSDLLYLGLQSHRTRIVLPCRSRVNDDLCVS